MHTHTHTPTQTHKHHRDIQTATRRPYRDTQHKETHHTNPYTQTHTHTQRVLEVILWIHTGTEVRL